MKEAATATMIEADKPRDDEKLTRVYTTTMLMGGPGRLPTAVERMLGLLDGARTLEEVCGLCGLQPHKAVAVAGKLEALGMICTCGRERAAFSDMEEEFFAAELPAEEAPPEPPWAQRLFARILRRNGSSS